MPGTTESASLISWVPIDSRVDIGRARYEFKKALSLDNVVEEEEAAGDAVVAVATVVASSSAGAG